MGGSISGVLHQIALIHLAERKGRKGHALVPRVFGDIGGLARVIGELLGFAGVIIAAAGGAAHLGGVIASSTTLPVIGVPIQTSALGGMDSLLSTVQMPGGIPVATVAIGKAGAKNAAILAAQMLALSDEAMAEKMVAFKASMAEKVIKDSVIEVE